MKHKILVILTVILTASSLLLTSCHQGGQQPIQIAPPGFPTENGAPAQIGDDDQPGVDIGEPATPEFFIDVACSDETGKYTVIDAFSLATIEEWNSNSPSQFAGINKPKFHIGGAMKDVAGIPKNVTGTDDLVVWNQGSYLYLSNFDISYKAEPTLFLDSPITSLAAKKLDNGRILVAAGYKTGISIFFVEKNNDWQVVGDPIKLPVNAAVNKVEIFESPSILERHKKKIPFASQFPPMVDYIYFAVPNKGIYRIDSSNLENGCIELVQNIDDEDKIISMTANKNILAYKLNQGSSESVLESMGIMGTLMLNIMKNVGSEEAVDNVLNMMATGADLPGIKSIYKVVRLKDGSTSLPRSPQNLNFYPFDLLADENNLYATGFVYDKNALQTYCSSSSNPQYCLFMIFLHEMANDIEENTKTVFLKYDVNKLFNNPQPLPAKIISDEMIIYYKLADLGNNIYLLSQAGKLKKYIKSANVVEDNTIQNMYKKVNSITGIGNKLISATEEGLEIINTADNTITQNPSINPYFGIMALAENAFYLPSRDKSKYQLIEYNAEKASVNEIENIKYIAQCGNLELASRIFKINEDNGRILDGVLCLNQNNNLYSVKLYSYNPNGSDIRARAFNVGPCQNCPLKASEYPEDSTNQIIVSKINVTDVLIKNNKYIIGIAGSNPPGDGSVQKILFLEDVPQSITEPIVTEYGRYSIRKTGSFMKENNLYPPSDTYYTSSGRIFRVDLTNNTWDNVIGTNCPGPTGGSLNSFVYNEASVGADIFVGFTNTGYITYTRHSPIGQGCISTKKPSEFADWEPVSVSIVTYNNDAAVYSLDTDGNARFFGVDSILDSIDNTSIIPAIKNVNLLEQFTLPTITNESDFVMGTTADNGVEFYLFEDILPQ